MTEGDKHYFRMKQFLTFDIQDRTSEEQTIILQQVSIAAKDLLKELKKE